MEDAGVKVIDQWWRWVYLQKKSSDGPFKMYTDVESKIAQYSKIKNFFSVILVIEVICFLIELMSAITSGYYLFVIFTVLLALISIAILKIVWKCKWKIEQYTHEKDMY